MLTLIRWIAINPLDSVIRLLNNWARVERHGFETRLGHYVVFLGKMFHSYSSYSACVEEDFTLI